MTIDISDFRDDEVLFAAVENLVAVAAQSARHSYVRKADNTLTKAKGLANAAIQAGALVGLIARAAVSIQRSALLSRNGKHRGALQEAIGAGKDTEEVWRVWLAWQRAEKKQGMDETNGPPSRPGTANTAAQTRHSPSAGTDTDQDLPSWVERAICVTVQANHNIALELEYLEYEEVSNLDFSLQENSEAVLSCKALIQQLHRYSASMAENLLPPGHHVRQLAEMAEADAKSRLEEVHEGIVEWNATAEDVTISAITDTYVDPGYYTVMPSRSKTTELSEVGKAGATAKATAKARPRPSTANAAQRGRPSNGEGFQKGVAQLGRARAQSVSGGEELMKIPLEQRRLLAESTLGTRCAGRHEHAKTPATGKLFAQPAMMKAPSDYYSFLGIPKGTEDSEVISAAKDRMLSLVDPAVLGNGARRLQDAAHNAFQTLSDKERRLEYDKRPDTLICVNTRSSAKRGTQRLTSGTGSRPSSAPSKGSRVGSRPTSSETKRRPATATASRPESAHARVLSGGGPGGGDPSPTSQVQRQPSGGTFAASRPTTPSHVVRRSAADGDGKKVVARRDPLKPQEEDLVLQRDLFEDWLRENGGLDRKKLFYSQLNTFEGMRTLQDDFRRKSKTFRQLHLKGMSPEDLFTNRIHYSGWGIQVREMMERKKKAGLLGGDRRPQSAPATRAAVFPAQQEGAARSHPQPFPLSSPQHSRPTSPQLTITPVAVPPATPSGTSTSAVPAAGASSTAAAPLSVPASPVMSRSPSGRSGKKKLSSGGELREMAKDLKRSVNHAWSMHGDHHVKFAARSELPADVLLALQETQTPRSEGAAAVGQDSFLQTLAFSFGKQLMAGGSG